MVGRRHASEEIAAKLAQANELATKGKTHREISKALGVSVMTYHRWRKMMKADAEHIGARVLNNVAGGRAESNDSEVESRLKRLEAENAHLRRFVIDMLLEMLKRDDDIPMLHELSRPGRGSK